MQYKKMHIANADFPKVVNYCKFCNSWHR